MNFTAPSGIHYNPFQITKLMMTDETHVEVNVGGAVFNEEFPNTSTALLFLSRMVAHSKLVAFRQQLGISTSLPIDMPYFNALTIQRAIERPKEVSNAKGLAKTARVAITGDSIVELYFPERVVFTEESTPTEVAAFFERLRAAVR